MSLASTRCLAVAVLTIGSITGSSPVASAGDASACSLADIGDEARGVLERIQELGVRTGRPEEVRVGGVHRFPSP